MSYILPQVQVFQVFRHIPQNLTQNLNAFIFGANYKLYRYNVQEEQGDTKLGVYDNTNTQYPWPTMIPGAKVDDAYTKLFVENLEAKYATFAVVRGADANDLTSDNLVFRTQNGVTRTSNFLRNVQTGDILKYSYEDNNGNTVEGTTVVSGFKAESVPPVFSDVNGGTDNAEDANGNLGEVTEDSGNTSTFDDITVDEVKADTGFIASLSAGVIKDDITVNIVKSGAAGVAQADVIYGSGIYNRRVTIEESTDSGIAGVVYIGNNLVLSFEGSSTFNAGDTYGVTPTAEFKELGTSEINYSDTAEYRGTRDNTYVVEVVRGGKFIRSVDILGSPNGGSNANKLVAGIGGANGDDWDVWVGGDIDEEYVIRCTSGGNLATAKFDVTSITGDNASGISFTEVSGDTAIGSYGVYAAFTEATTFATGDTYVIKVNACRPRIKFYDTVGTVVANHKVVAQGDLAIGNDGFAITINDNDNNGLRKGDTYTFDVTSAKAGKVNTLVLADDIGNANVEDDDTINVKLYLKQSGVEITSKNFSMESSGNYNWTTDDNGINISSGWKVQDNSWVDTDGTKPWLPVESAEMFVEYRVLLTDYADGIYNMETIDDVAGTLGTIHPDNPLAQGVYHALLNSGDRSVYYMAIPSDDIDGWSAVLDKAGISSEVYAFAPLTQDKAIIDMVIGHVNNFSGPETKRWRMAFTSTALETIAPIYTSDNYPDAGDYTAFIEASGAGDNTKFDIIRFVDESLVQCNTQVKPGDTVRINFGVDAYGEVEYDEYTVDKVLSNTRIKLTAPTQSLSYPTRVEVWHPLTRTETAEAVASASEGFFSRRVVNVFPPVFTHGGVSMTGEFGASAVAGLVSSVAPQQPLTNVEVQGIDDASMSYQMFNTAQLNTMAAAGTLILAQDTRGGRVYVRHQLTTAASGGNLNETELSLIKNMDSASYYFANLYAPYIGSYNVTPELLDILNNITVNAIERLTHTYDPTIGPQIIGEGTTIDVIMQDPVMADRVICQLTLNLPKPFNQMQLTLIG